MFRKKNVFSYVLWLFLAAVSLGGLFGLITCRTSVYQMPVYVSFLGVVGFSAVAYALMFLVRHVIDNRLNQAKLSDGVLNAWSGWVFCCVWDWVVSFDIWNFPEFPETLRPYCLPLLMDRILCSLRFMAQVFCIWEF